MSDLIDREALLRQINIDSEGEPGYYGDTWKFIDTIKRMPSVQPTFDARDTQYNLPIGTDTISRQAAIDYFVTNVGFHDEDGYPIEDECELREIWTGYFDGIPSAQPERIKGRWERDGHHIKCDQCGEWMCDRDREGWDYAKNFCPNCGADMKGEQDG